MLVLILGFSLLFEDEDDDENEQEHASALFSDALRSSLTNHAARSFSIGWSDKT